MDKLSRNIESDINKLKSDFQNLELDISLFKSVFTLLLGVLEKMTEFFKLGHAAEISRVIDSGEDAFAQAKNLLNIEFPNLLVAQAKLMKEKAEDYAKKTKGLLNIQEDENENLRKKFETTHSLLNESITPFILSSKEHLLTMGTGAHGQNKATQKECYRVVNSCLEQIRTILEQIRARYTNLFKEGKPLEPPPIDDLDEAAADLFDSLAKLKTAKPENKLEAAKAVPAATKATLAAMDTHECPMIMKEDLVGAVKQARDGDIPEYFDALKILEQTLEKAKAMQPAPFQISMDNLKIEDKGGPKDLLEAAKRMCAALSGLNITLDT